MVPHWNCKIVSLILVLILNWKYENWSTLWCNTHPWNALHSEHITGKKKASIFIHHLIKNRESQVQQKPSSSNKNEKKIIKRKNHSWYSSNFLTNAKKTTENRERRTHSWYSFSIIGSAACKRDFASATASGNISALWYTAIASCTQWIARKYDTACMQMQCGVNFFILDSVHDRSQPWACGDVFWPKLPRCWDPISKQISNPRFCLKAILKKKGGVRIWDPRAVWHQGILGRYIHPHTKHRAHNQVN